MSPGGRQAAVARRLPVAFADRLTYRHAAHVAPAASIVEDGSRLVHELARRGLRGREDKRDVRIRERRELAHDERVPLALRQLADVGDRLGELRPALGLARGARSGHGRRLDLGQVLERRLWAAAAKIVDRGVPGDAEEPRPDSVDLLARLERRERLGHRGLKHVGGFLGITQQRHAVAKERLMMAAVELAERGFVAGRGTRRETPLAQAVQGAYRDPGERPRGRALPVARARPADVARDLRPAGSGCHLASASRPIRARSIDCSPWA